MAIGELKKHSVAGGGIQSINGQSATAQTITVQSGLALSTATNAWTFGLSSNYINASVINTTGQSSSFLAADGTYRTIAAGTGAGGVAIQGSGTYIHTSGTVQFNNANGLTFGLSTDGVITASHNGITTQTGNFLSTNADTAYAMNSLFAGTNISGTLNSSAFNLSVAASGNSTSFGYQSATPSQITGASSVLFNNGAWNTVLTATSAYISTAGSTSFGSQSATPSQTTGATSVLFNNGAWGTVITTLGNYLTTAASSNYAINSLFAGTNISGTLNSTAFNLSVLASGNSTSFGSQSATPSQTTTASSVLYNNGGWSATTLNARQSATPSQTTGASSVLANNYAWVTVVTAAPTILAAHAGTAFSGTNISGTINSTALQLNVAASGNSTSFGYQSATPTQITGASSVLYNNGAWQTVAAGGGIQSINGQSATAQTITVQSGLALSTATNAWTFGLSSNYINASVINTTGQSSSFLAADGTYRTVGGGTSNYTGVIAHGLSASTTNVATFGSIYYQGNNITIGFTTNANSSHTMNFSVAAAGGGNTINGYAYPLNWYQSVSSHTVVTNSISMQQMLLLQNVSFSEVNIPMFISGITTTNTSARTFTISAYVVFYTSNGSTLSPFAGASKTQTGTWASAASTTNFCGYRMLTFPLSSTLTPGYYWVGFNMQTASSVGANSMSIIVNNLSTAMQFANFGQSTNTSNNEGMRFGMISTSSYNSTNTTITLHFSNILNNASQMLRGNFPVILRNF